MTPPSDGREILKDLLAKFSAPTPIAFSRHPLRPRFPDEPSAESSRALAPGTAKRLHALAATRGASVALILESAWLLLLARTSGEASVVVGAAAPPAPEALPLRVAVEPRATFLEWLETVRTTNERFLKCGDVSLADARLWCDVPPTEPLFHSVFFVSGERLASSAPLELVASIPSSGEVTLTLHFVEACLDQESAARLLDALTALIEAAVAEPETPIGRLPLVSDRERERLLVELNHTEMDFPRALCLHQLFEEQARRTPRATAVTFERVSLTYEELDARAERLALHLRRLGAGPNVLIGFCAERCLDTAIGVLAILKAGSAYVPIDPDSPRERRELILDDSEAKILVTQRRLAAGVPPRYRGAIVYMDGSWEEPDREVAPASTRAVSPGDLSYVIYTSGSTGKPKGCAIRHQGVVSQMVSFGESFGIGPDDKLVAVSSLTFDIATLDLFLPWSKGAEVVIASGAAKRDGKKLRELIERSDATVVQATPVTWRLLLAAGWEGSAKLTALCGGEALSRELADELLARARAVWNLYGPTETTIWATRHRVERGQGPVLVGRPIGNTRCYLLDSNKEPLPVGVPGELYVGGVGVQGFYWRRPEITRDTFLDDPFAGEPGAKMFKTGDLARQLPDGAFEHLGRKDFQVKIRGFRIELGEIESALASHPDVRESVVVAREDVPGERRLVAYVVPREKPGPSAPALRRFLAEKLADYMLPQAFVTLEALPCLGSMKIDRRALPAPDWSRAVPERAALAPRDPLEEQVTLAWEEVLKIHPIGVKDDIFMELGADSIAATDVAGRLSKRLGREIAPEVLCEQRTVEGIAAALRAGERFTVQSQLVTLSLGSTKPDLFLVHSAGADAFAYLPLVRKLDGTDTVHVIQNRYRYTDGSYESLEAMAQEYVALVRRKQPRGPYRLGGWSLGGAVAFEIANRLVAQGETVSGLVLFDTNYPWRALYRKWFEVRSWAAGLRYRIARRFPRLALAIPGTRRKLARIRERSPVRRLLWLIGTLAFLGQDERPVFTDELFPGMFEPGELEPLAPDAAWARLHERVTRDAPDPREIELGQTFETTRRRARAFAREDQIERAWSPRWVYPGELTLFAVRGSRESSARRWQEYAARPIVLREFDLAPTERLTDPHDAMMQPANVAVFADELKRFVERTRLAPRRELVHQGP